MNRRKHPWTNESPSAFGLFRSERHHRRTEGLDLLCGKHVLKPFQFLERFDREAWADEDVWQACDLQVLQK